MKGSGDGAASMICALGERLGALHIHDNDKRKDFHAIPFSMDIDFESVVKALEKINYKGYLTLEVIGYLKSFDKDNILEGMIELAQSDRMIEKVTQ